jgi:DNA invertase Pin-like site-specific DNA recombinase
MPMTRPVAYYRMSNDKQEDSISKQQAQVRAHAAKHNYQIVREYADPMYQKGPTP